MPLASAVMHKHGVSLAIGVLVRRVPVDKSSPKYCEREGIVTFERIFHTLVSWDTYLSDPFNETCM